MNQDLSGYTKDYYQRELDEYWFERNGLLRPDQLAALCYVFGIPFFGEHSERRNPGTIYSIGCGAGVLEQQLEEIGCDVIGVDPSQGARKLYRGSKLIPEYTGGGDTIIFCESIEHIPMPIIESVFSKIPLKARVIITNWVDLHPLFPDGSGKDHITLIDDDFYNTLSIGRRVVLRRGSHLVLDDLMEGIK